MKSAKSSTQNTDEECNLLFCSFFRSSNKKKTNMEKSGNSSTKNKNNNSNRSSIHYGVSPLMDSQQQSSEKLKKSQIKQNPKVSNFISQEEIQKFPQNELFLLKNQTTGDSILAKITEINFSQMKIDQSIHFQSCYDDNVQKNTDDLASKHIAHRVKNIHQKDDKKDLTFNYNYYQSHSLIEYGCGNGKNTVKFAQELDLIIAVDLDPEACKNTKLRCQTEKVEQKVEIVNADIFKLQKRLLFDVLFINPSVENQCTNILNDCCPNIQQLLTIIYDKIENLVIQFPAIIDYSQIPLLLNITQQYYKLQNAHQPNNDFSKYISHCYVEIEKIFIDGKHTYNVVYYGNIANITRVELRQYLTQQLQNEQFRSQDIEQVIIALKKQIGGLSLVYELLSAQKFKLNIENFLQNICNKYNLNQREYTDILYKRLFSQDTFQPKNTPLINNSYEKDQEQFGYSPKFSYGEVEYIPQETYQMQIDEQIYE